MQKSQSTFRARIERWLNDVWYANAKSGLVLVPLSWLYRAATSFRRFLYRIGMFRSFDAGAPVIVVGNITAGGTGKTPFVIWLAGKLRDNGRNVAVVTRGYRGQVGSRPVRVDPDHHVASTGDEPQLIALRTGVPVYCHSNRVEAARLAVEEGADVVIADDGLQHYRLKRDVEIAMIDGERRFGNARMLPAGPLREGVTRLSQADLVICTGSRPGPGEVGMALELQDAVSLTSGERRPLAAFAGQRCHAIAGIANPGRFFQALESVGLELVHHAPGDHADLSREDIRFNDGAAVLMTEKDAVRCRHIAGPEHWAVPVTAVLGSGELARVDSTLQNEMAK